MTTLRMRECRAEDIDSLVDVYFAAFDGNPIQVRVFPDNSDQARLFWQGNLRDNFADPYVRIRVVEDTAVPDNSSGQNKIVAFAVWHAPRPAGAPFVPFPDNVPWPQNGNPAVADTFFRDLDRQHKRYMSDPATGQQIPHWFLELIATDPAYQGRGAAGLLLRFGEAQADAANVPCYLDATPAGLRVYTSAGHGFHAVETKAYFDNAYEHVFMVRDPRPAAAAAAAAET
ncbi:Acyl-CoA N-acyltransferase [Niveomyces insectorum RCEF 264]|uniref:Acyl-CoA N-acyltransferase n=1 Tax=Niveomyces insectorum RCEF 264 TaxID=1081102 RepID=A0A167XA43_9HYPO|nr:Acyl-CoA N-acyltransferase [Niveomyces insectorum RCEF 264]